METNDFDFLERALNELDVETCSEFSTALKSLSSQDFKNYGLYQVGYIREVQTDIGSIYALCSADGAELKIFESQDRATYFANEVDIKTASIH